MIITLRLVNDALVFAQNGVAIQPEGQGDIDISPGNVAEYGNRRVSVQGEFKAGQRYELCGNAEPTKNRKFFDLRTGKEVGHLTPPV